MPHLCVVNARLLTIETEASAARARCREATHEGGGVIGINMALATEVNPVVSTWAHSEG